MPPHHTPIDCEAATGKVHRSRFLIDRRIEMFDWLFRRKPKAVVTDPTLDWPSPMRGSYEVLPAGMDWFDWTDYDSAYLTVDGDGTVKLHAEYAHRVGIEWTSMDYTVIGHINPPGAMWVQSYWLRPSWYDEMIARSAALEAAWEVA